MSEDGEDDPMEFLNSMRRKMEAVSALADISVQQTSLAHNIQSSMARIDALMAEEDPAPTSCSDISAVGGPDISAEEWRQRIEKLSCVPQISLALQTNAAVSATPDAATSAPPASGEVSTSSAPQVDEAFAASDNHLEVEPVTQEGVEEIMDPEVAEWRRRIAELTGAPRGAAPPLAVPPYQRDDYNERPSAIASPPHHEVERAAPRHRTSCARSSPQIKQQANREEVGADWLLLPDDKASIHPGRHLDGHQHKSVKHTAEPMEAPNTVNVAPPEGEVADDELGIAQCCCWFPATRYLNSRYSNISGEGDDDMARRFRH